MVTAKPFTRQQLAAFRQMLDDVDKPFGHFEIDSDVYIRNAAGITARAIRDKKNFSLVRDGKQTAHITVCQRERPDWDEDGPRLLATAEKLIALVDQLRDALLLAEHSYVSECAFCGCSRPGHEGDCVVHAALSSCGLKTESSRDEARKNLRGP